MNEELLVDSDKNYSYELTLNDLLRSGKYDPDFIGFLKKGDLDSITLYTTEAQREDTMFMEPLLYAVKHDLDTFEVFKYCTETLQRDVAKDVIREEPELIAETPLSRDAKFIINNARLVPEIVRYADESILADNFVVYSLCRVNGRVAGEVLKYTNANVRAVMGNEIQATFGSENLRLPALNNDRSFISAAIQEKGAGFLKYASEEIKNDYSFLKEQATKDPSIIDYVIKNIDEFGKEGIDAVRDATKDKTVEDVMSSLGEDDPVFKILKAEIEKHGKDDPALMRKMTACLAKAENDIQPETLKSIIDYSLLTMESLKKELEEKGTQQFSFDEKARFVPPEIINILIEKMELQGVQLDEETRQRLEDYSNFYNEYSRLFNEKRSQIIKENIQMMDAGITEEEFTDLIKKDQHVGIYLTSIYIRTDNPKPEVVKVIIDSYLKLFEETKKNIDEQGYAPGIRDGSELVSSNLMLKLKGVLEENGIEIDEETKNKIEEYIEFANKYRDKRVETTKESTARFNGMIDKVDYKSSQARIDRFTSILNYDLNKMHDMMMNVDENGNMIIDIKSARELPRTLELTRLKDDLEARGIVLSDEMEEKLNIFLDFHENYWRKARELYNKSSISFTLNDINSILAARRESGKSIVGSAMKTFESKDNKTEDDLKRYEIFQEVVSEYGEDDPRAILGAVKVYCSKGFDITLGDFQNIVNYVTYTMDALRNNLDENGKMIISSEQFDLLLGSIAINACRIKLERQGITIDEETQNKLDEYLDFYSNYRVKVQNQRKEKSKEIIEKINNGASAEELADLNDSEKNMLNITVRALLSHKAVKQDFWDVAKAKTVIDSFMIVMEREKDSPSADYKTMLTPAEMNRLLEILKDNGTEIDEELINKINEYKEFFSAYKKLCNEKKVENQKKAEEIGKILASGSEESSQVSVSEGQSATPLSMDSIVELVSDQKISDIKNEEQKLVVNLQETMKKTNGNQISDNTTTTNQQMEENEDIVQTDDVR